tara:strand:- start:667 stop:1137 length:471 start_codon:yes stop_codon:yes gene_type:complete
MKKNLKYFFIFLFLFGCGYTPIYQVKKDSNIKIDIINFSGDKNIGREIIRGLENFRKTNAKNIFDLDISTLKQESIVTKDKKGNPTSYKLVLTVNAYFTDKINNKNYEKKFNKQMSYNSKSNKFELDQLKINLEKNMISQILQDMKVFLGIIGNDL